MSLPLERRRRLLHRAAPALSICLVLSISCTDPPRKSPPPRPNVILVSIDTLRSDHVGAYGYDAPTTPHLDRFAQDSTLFTNNIAHATSTLASHASILTSVLPHQHGASVALGAKLNPETSPFTEILRENGYRTASFNGGIQLDAVYGLDRGFDVYESIQGKDAEALVLAGDENRTSGLVERSLDWIDQGTKEEPFFLFVHSYEIHHPYTPTKEHLELLDAGYDGPLPDAISVELLREVNDGTRRLSDADRAHIIHAYDAELRSADEALGSFFAALRERGLYENSLIIVTSDHGEEFGEHGKMGWHSHALYDEQIRVPLLIKYPGGVRAGRITTEQVQGIDIAPTLLATLDLPQPSDYTGIDVRTLDDSGDGEDRPAVSILDWSRSPLAWAVRTSRWKLHWVGGYGLFDLDRDPGEERNLAKTHRTVTDGLQAQATELLAEDRMPELVPAAPTKKTIEQLRALGYLE